MRDITIHNFRCYAEKSMTFRRGINLLIGDNSAGKTSLLRACNLVANSFFCGFSDENTAWKSADDDDFRVISNDEIEAPELPINITFHLDDNDCPPIVLADGKTARLEARQSMDDISPLPDLCIEKKSKKNSRNLVTGLKPLKEYAALLQANSTSIVDGKAEQRNALPLFAYFTTEDIHTTRKFDKEKRNFKKYPQKQSFGYFESFDCKGLLDCWTTRLLVLKEARKGEQEIACVQKAIASALGPDGCGIISGIDIRVNDRSVVFCCCDGREEKADLLSDGYRRLVSIVVDLAFRSALLNKIAYGDEAYRHTHGTVIIDEIDEHLHPELQVRILKALRQTFARMQFIVSTHAPLVMSSVETNDENVVYKLEFKDGAYTHTELNTYGLDASSIMELYMGNVSRDLDAAKAFKQLFAAIDDEKYDEARAMLDTLKTRYGSDTNTELVRAEAMLSFMED